LPPGPYAGRQLVTESNRRDLCIHHRGGSDLVTQLRGEAKGRQIHPVPNLALAQNAGGFVEGDNAVAIVTILERTR
jgi:hypothetical protein